VTGVLALVGELIRRPRRAALRAVARVEMKVPSNVPADETTSLLSKVTVELRLFGSLSRWNGKSSPVSV